MIRKVYLLVSLLYSIIFINNIYATTEIRVGVLDFSSNSVDPKYRQFGLGLAEMYSAALVNDTGKGIYFLPRSRSDLKRIKDEIDFGKTSAVNSETAVKAGKLLGANYLLTGLFTEINQQVRLDIKVFDIESGIAIISDSQRGIADETLDLVEVSQKNVIGKFNKMKNLAVKIRETKKTKVEAVLALSDGMKAQDDGDKRRAKKYYETALEIDPEFVIAKEFLRRLSSAAEQSIVILDPSISSLKMESKSVFNNQYLIYGGYNFNFLSASGFSTIQLTNQAIHTDLDNKIGEIDYRDTSTYVFGMVIPISNTIAYNIEYDAFIIEREFSAEPDIALDIGGGYSILHTGIGLLMNKLTAIGFGLDWRTYDSLPRVLASQLQENEDIKESQYLRFDLADREGGYVGSQFGYHGNITLKPKNYVVGSINLTYFPESKSTHFPEGDQIELEIISPKTFQISTELSLALSKNFIFVNLLFYDKISDVKNTQANGLTKTTNQDKYYINQMGYSRLSGTSGIEYIHNEYFQIRGGLYYEKLKFNSIIVKEQDINFGIFGGLSIKLGQSSFVLNYTPFSRIILDDLARASMIDDISEISYSNFTINALMEYRFGKPLIK
ncbi:MAG: hypothetical protein OEZ22_14325 [Spirochaetia bacterium]|nr:hypothetical protein [Spirochaetia bacterium]